MKRRDFIALLGGAAAAWPIAARAQESAIRKHRIGFLTTASGATAVHRVFEAALADYGYQETGNLTIERRYAVGSLERLPALAAELVTLPVDVIVTETTPAALAAKRATTTIPIVMATSGDAVRSGLVASLARPGGNITGMTFIGTETVTKTVEILFELRPQIRRVAFLGHHAITPERLAFGQLQATATALGITAQFVDVVGGWEAAFGSVVESGADAISVANNPVFVEQRKQIVGLATRHKLLAGYGRREFAEAGGLFSYGTNFTDLFKSAALIVDKILKGAKPADLPVEQPTRFDLVINLKTAKALSLTVPPTLLARADEVIE